MGSGPGQDRGAGVDAHYDKIHLFERGDARPGTVLISGTISMLHGVNQFADTWKVAMTDPATQDVIGVEYRTVRMPEPIG